MKPTLSNLTSLQRITTFLPIPNSNSNSFLTVSPNLQLSKQLRFIAVSSSNAQTTSRGSESSIANPVHSSLTDLWTAEIRSPVVLPFVSRFSPGDRVSFLLAFIACTTSVAFTGLVIAAVPTLFAMRRTATSLANLADTAREELPSTMAAIRLSSMEISDLTLELSDLSQEVSEGISKSAQAVQAAEAGIKQIGTLAHHQTISMIEERANLPVISLQPVVFGAAKKTSRAVGTAARTILSLISRGRSKLVSSEDEEAGNRRLEEF